MPKTTKNGRSRKILRTIQSALDPNGYRCKLRNVAGTGPYLFVTRTGDDSGTPASVIIHVGYPKSGFFWKATDPTVVHVDHCRFREQKSGDFNLCGIADRVRAQFLEADYWKARDHENRRIAAMDAEMQERLEKLAPASCPVLVNFQSELNVGLTLGPVPAVRAEQILRWLARMPDVVFLRGQVWRHKTQGFESEITEVKDNGYVVLHSGQGPDLLLLQRELVERWELTSPSTEKEGA